MDAIDSRNPTNFETKKKNGSKKNIETNHVVQDHQSMSYKTIKVCRTRPSPNKKHQNDSIRETHRKRNIFSVTTIMRQYTKFPKINWQKFSK